MLGLVAAALALRCAFALTVPVFQAPDERAHLDYVKHLVEKGALPVQPAITPEEALSSWPQSYQPPLAYLLFAPNAALASGAGAGPAQVLRLLRLQNAILGALLVAAVYGVARRLRPAGDPLRLLAPLLVATLPGLCTNASSVNNDTLANLLTAGLWLVWLEPKERRLGAGHGLRVGLLFGAACLAKLTAACLAPLLLVVPWLQRRDGVAALREAAVASAVALLLLAPWLLRNVAIYGDPLALGVGSFRFDQLAPFLPPELMREVASPAPGKALLQLFGRFGITNNLSWSPVLGVWLPLAVLGAAGWLRRRSDPARTVGAGTGTDMARVVPCLLVATLLGVAGLVSFSLQYYGAWQGRYLYVCMVPIAILLGEGGARWLPRRWELPVALLAVALFALDVALLLELDAFFDTNPAALWGRRTHL